jgi:hypothetical protein
VCRGCRTGCNEIDTPSNLRDIVFDEELRTSICSIVQSRCSYVSQVTDETASDEIDEIDDISVFFGCVEGREALVDQAVIVMLANGTLSPVLCVSLWRDLLITNETKAYHMS